MTDTTTRSVSRVQRLSPEVGWLPLLLLLALAFLTGRAIDEARWLPGPETYTDFLPWTAMLGVLTGFVTSILGWGRLRSAFAGAIVAALIVPFLVGVVLVPDVESIVTQYRAAADSAVEAVIDLIVLGRGTTTQFGHSMVLLGFLMWGTGQFAAIAVYRYGRAMPAVVALGAYLVINVSLTPVSQLAYLVGFSLVALLLLVRMHAVDARREWVRRRIGDPAPLASLTLRTGTVFVTIAVLGSLALTTAAHSKPLQAVWQEIGVQEALIDVGRTLQRYIPYVSNPRGPAGVDFGPSAQIGLIWTADQTTALLIQRDSADREALYWRAATYDRFDGDGWFATDGGQVDRGADQVLTQGTSEQVLRPGFREVSVSVFPEGYSGSQAFSPGAPTTLDLGSKVVLDADGGFITGVEVERKTAYDVSGIVPITDEKADDVLTESMLRAAGTGYFAELTPEQVERYTSVADGVIGPAAAEVAESARRLALSDAPYDQAVALRDYLADPLNFSYETDISSVPCGGRGAVECFSEFRQGFCQYYASTMAVLLRAQGIPTRFVQGFLPGARTPDGVETIENAGSHAWVEVWFPGYGWFMFDPTGNGLGDQAPVLPPGQAIPIPSRTPRPSGVDSDDVNPPRPVGSIPAGSGTTGDTSGSGPGPFIAIAILLAIAVGGLAFLAYRRGPREVTPDTAWGSVTRVAKRLGFGPRPTQTVYEYSAALAEVLPSVRPELQTVAQAKVEVAYGHRVLSPARVDAVKAATSRLRIRLLRLIWRRPRRRR